MVLEEVVSPVAGVKRSHRKKVVVDEEVEVATPVMEKRSHKKKVVVEEDMEGVAPVMEKRSHKKKVVVGEEVGEVVAVKKSHKKKKDGSAVKVAPAEVVPEPELGRTTRRSSIRVHAEPLESDKSAPLYKDAEASEESEEEDRYTPVKKARSSAVAVAELDSKPAPVTVKRRGKLVLLSPDTRLRRIVSESGGVKKAGKDSPLAFAAIYLGDEGEGGVSVEEGKRPRRVSTRVKNASDYGIFGMYPETEDREFELPRVVKDVKYRKR
ncbi:hypothetical protein HDU98_004214 [Podochytrium sp. JEL0797]|nr:hypothetical protein HDU98_004214 [Podochytrium sp. JEL0797]